MSTDLDTARIVRSWLEEEGRTTLPDWIRDGVMDRLPATPQRRHMRSARRFTTMPTAAKTALAAAAVILVAVGALAFLQRPSGPGGPGVTVTPSPSTAPTPTASALPVSDLPQSGSIPPGTYRVPGNHILVTVPAGWDVVDGRDMRKNRDQPTEIALVFWRPDIAVFADACSDSATPLRTGPTADDLLADLRAQDSSDISEPVAVTIGEVAAKRFVVSPTEGIDPATCNGGVLFHYWAGVGNGNDFGSTGNPVEMYVAETGSGRAVFSRLEGPDGQSDATAADRAVLDAIMESMVIED
jgi:hypothetical protein